MLNPSYTAIVVVDLSDESYIAGFGKITFDVHYYRGQGATHWQPDEPAEMSVASALAEDGTDLTQLFDLALLEDANPNLFYHLRDTFWEAIQVQIDSDNCAEAEYHAAIKDDQRCGMD